MYKKQYPAHCKYYVLAVAAAALVVSIVVAIPPGLAEFDQEPKLHVSESAERKKHHGSSYYTNFEYIFSERIGKMLLEKSDQKVRLFVSFIQRIFMATYSSTTPSHLQSWPQVVDPCCRMIIFSGLETHVRELHSFLLHRLWLFSSVLKLVLEVYIL